MAGGFAMIIGGAAKGWAEGRKAEIQAKREEYLRQLAEDRDDRRAREARDFQAKITSAGKGQPATVEEANWLISNGIAKDAKEAYQLVKQSRSDDPEKSRAAIYKKWLEVLKGDSLGKIDSAKIAEEAQKRTDETMRYLNADEPAASAAPPPAGASNAPASSAPAAPPPTGDQPPPSRDFQSTWVQNAEKMASTGGGFDRSSTKLPAGAKVGLEWPAAPKDPADRKVGTVYRSPNGKVGRWTEKGWVLVQ